MGFHGDLWDFMVILWDFMVIYRILWWFMGFYGDLWDFFMVIYGILWWFMGFYGDFNMSEKCQPLRVTEARLEGWSQIH